MNGETSPAVKAWYKTARWRNLRLRQLQQHPLCRMCMDEGKVTPAKVCDHIEPHRGDPVLFWSGPFQSLCIQHHNADKQQIENHGYSNEIGLDGYPTDPNHPFNRPPPGGKTRK